MSHTATVLLDGEQIAQHYNAYTPFSVIKKDLTEGTHLLEIKVDNRFTEKSALHIPNDYMSYGGVSRPVVLEKLVPYILNMYMLKHIIKMGNGQPA